MNWLLVFVGGGLGSLARYSFSEVFKTLSLKLPVATLASNVVASFIIGAVVYLLNTRGMLNSTGWWFFLAIGFCSGLSTFSTFSLETVQLFREGLIGTAILNISLNLLVCLMVIWIFSTSALK